MFASRGDEETSALRMRLFELTNSCSHKCDQLKTLPPMNHSLGFPVQSFGMDWRQTWWQGHTSNNCFETSLMLGNNASLGSLVTATHMAGRTRQLQVGEKESRLSRKRPGPVLHVAQVVKRLSCWEFAGQVDQIKPSELCGKKRSGHMCLLNHRWQCKPCVHFRGCRT